MNHYITLAYQNNIYSFNKIMQTKKFLLYLFIIFILFSIYFFQIMSLSSKGYLIKKMESQNISLKIETQHLEAQLAETQQSQQISELVKQLKLVETRSIVYINTDEESLASADEIEFSN